MTNKKMLTERWLKWCWCKPVWMGLPLCLLVIPIIYADFLRLSWVAITHWGR